MVGATGFEPATSCSQSKCSTRLSYAPNQCLSDADGVNARKDQPEPDSDWQKTPFVNLIRYKPSHVYFARFQVKGKLIRRSLKTNQLTVAKLRLSDLEKSERSGLKAPMRLRMGK